MLDQLPEEIQIEILLRLPADVVVRCACVSKSLFSLLTSQTFVDAHMKENNHKSLFFLKYYLENKQRELFVLQPDDESFDWELFESFEIPEECHCWSFRFVGSVNGVICLSSYRKGIVLWNPLIRKYLSIPILREEHIVMGVGFGFDSLTNDYKVVRLVYYRYLPSPKVEVYCVKSGYWRPAKGSGPTHRITIPEYSQCFLNGIVHWASSMRPDDPVIVTFGLHDDVFGEIEMPHCLVDVLSLHTKLKLDTCRDMLAIIMMHGRTCSVWVMKEYGVVNSWTQIFSLKIPYYVVMPKAFGFRQKKEMIVLIALRYSKDELLFLDQNGLVTKVSGTTFKYADNFCTGTYVKSLALFKEGKATTKITTRSRKGPRYTRDLTISPQHYIKGVSASIRFPENLP